MKSKFYDCLEEIMTASAVGIGGKQETPNVDPINDDSYARGDARIPNPPKRNKRKRKKKVVKEEVFKYALRTDQAFKIIKDKFPDKKFQSVTSVIPKNVSDMTLKAQIVTDIITPANKLANENNLKVDSHTVNFKNIMDSLEPHIKSDRVLIVGVYVKSKKVGVTWTLV